MLKVDAVSILKRIVATSSLKLDWEHVGVIKDGGGVERIFVRPSLKLHRHLRGLKVKVRDEPNDGDRHANIRGHF
jgi:hypothetical protein